MEYLIVKWVHVLSSTVLFGTGAASAFYLLMASLRSPPATVAAVVGNVVIADWIFTLPTAILQPASGYWLVKLAGFPMKADWLLWSSILYAVAIGCWLPVLVLQVRMRDIARAAAAGQRALPEAYWWRFRVWVALGTVALLAFLAIFLLMVLKPQ